MIYDIFCQNTNMVKTCTMFNIYTRSSLKDTQKYILTLPEFQKQMLQKSFRQTYGRNLPYGCNIYTFAALRMKSNTCVKPSLYSSRLSLGTKKPGLRMKETYHLDSLHSGLEKASVFNHTQGMLSQNLGHLLCANWILNYILEHLKYRGNVRGVLNNVLRDVERCMHKQQSLCIIRGLRLVATGRLGKRKKAMSQQISRAVGKVPLSNLSAKVDYSARTANTKLGCVGLKVWVCYR